MVVSRVAARPAGEVAAAVVRRAAVVGAGADRVDPAQALATDRAVMVEAAGAVEVAGTAAT